jgi:hypothetical protein
VPRFFCDTTVIYYMLLGSPLQKRALASRSATGRLTLSNFVIGEFIRGYVAGLIELYMAIKEEASVEEGIRLFADEKVRTNPRAVRNALLTTPRWLMGLDDPLSVPKTLRRLGEHIRLVLFEIADEFPTRELDRLGCQIGLITFPMDSFDEDQILDFWDRLQTVLAEPSCNQCLFKAEKQAELAAAGIDVSSREQRERHADKKGFVKQSARIETALRSKKRRPTCWYCVRLGDGIISLSCPSDATLLTGDVSSFPSFAKILGFEIDIIPSNAELRAASAPPGRRQGRKNGKNKR